MHALILIVKAIIGTGLVPSREETFHLILIQIADTDIGVQILIIVIIHTALAVGHDPFLCKFLVVHSIRPPFIIGSISQKIYHCKTDFVKKALLCGQNMV